MLMLFLLLSELLGVSSSIPGDLDEATKSFGKQLWTKGPAQLRAGIRHPAVASLETPSVFHRPKQVSNSHVGGSLVPSAGAGADGEARDGNCLRWRGVIGLGHFSALLRGFQKPRVPLTSILHSFSLYCRCHLDFCEHPL